MGYVVPLTQFGSLLHSWYFCKAILMMMITKANEPYWQLIPCDKHTLYMCIGCVYYTSLNIPLIHGYGYCTAAFTWGDDGKQQSRQPASRQRCEPVTPQYKFTLLPTQGCFLKMHHICTQLSYKPRP